MGAIQKLKLYNNEKNLIMHKMKLIMNGFMAGESLKRMITNKKWWESVFSNMVATILGIVLTVGVAALVEYHNDKKLAREMMFNIVNTADRNVKILEGYDSIYNVKVEAITEIANVYVRYDKDLTKVPDDTLRKLETSFNSVLHVNRLDGYLQPSDYFNSAEMLHQFGNADLYAAFAEFVRMNQETFATIDDLNEQSLNILRFLARDGDFDSQPVCKRMNQLFENGGLSDFVMNVKVGAHLQMTISLYKFNHKLLLKMMDATEEEYNQYKEANKKENVDMCWDENYKL